MGSNVQNPSWSAGSKITGANLNLGEPVWSWKAGDQSLTSNTTMQNDNDLFLTLSAANATYLFDGYVVYMQNTSPGTADLKYQWTAPAGASLFVTGFGTSAASSTTTYDVTANGAGSVRTVPSNLTVAMSFEPRGYVQTAATTGNLQLQWAQNTTSTTPLFVKAGSWLRMWRVA